MRTYIGEICTKELFAAKVSTTPLPAKKPRPRGLYGTIPMPSSLHEQKHQESILMLQDYIIKIKATHTIKFSL
jgi:hypothetical protein